MRNHRVAEKLSLLETVVAPNFKQDVRATSIAILLDSVNALIRRPSNRANFFKHRIRNSPRRSLTPTRFHSVSNRPNLVEREPRFLKQHISRPANVLHFVRQIHRSHFPRAFFCGLRIFANAPNHHAAKIVVSRIFANLAATLLHNRPRISNEIRSRDASSQQTIRHAPTHALQHRPSSANVNRRNTTRRMCVRLQSRNVRIKYLPFIIKLLTAQHATNDFDRFLHRGSWTSSLAGFTFANFLHENLRSAESQKKASGPSNILQNTRFHSNLHGIARIRRNNPPTDRNFLSLPRNDRRDRRRRSCLVRMFAPPGIRFREPERVKARALARLRHRHGLRDRLHAQLQNANAKGNGHPVFSFGLVYRNLGIRPRMLEAFDQSPHRFIQRRRDANLLAPFHDRAIHKIHFRNALGEHVLQHAGVMLARRVRAFLHHRARIAVQRDAHSLRNGLALGNQVDEKLSGRRKTRSRAVMQQRQGADRIRRGVENEFRPLSPARIFEGNHVHTRFIQCLGEFVHARHRCIRRLKRPNPSVPFNVVSHMTRLDDVARRKRSAANHKLNVLGDDFLVSDAILYRANSSIVRENMRGLSHRRTRVCAFRGNDAVFAWRNFFGAGGGVQAGGEIRRTGDPQAVAIDGVHVGLRNVVGVHLDAFDAGEMRSEKAADCAGADDADLHRVFIPAFPRRNKISNPRWLNSRLPFSPRDKCPAYTDKLCRPGPRPADGKKKSCSRATASRISRRWPDARSWSCQWNVRKDAQARSPAWRKYRPKLCGHF